MIRFIFSVLCLLLAVSLAFFIWGAGKYRPLLVTCCLAVQLLVVYLFWYHLVHIPRWREAARGAGFNLLVLVPVNPLLARLMLLFSRTRLRPGKVRRAFELHIDAPRKYKLAEFARLLASDLSFVAGVLEPSTLLLWETAAPVPSLFRRYLRHKQELREAVWERGGWGSLLRPADPLVRRGALVWLGREREHFFGRCAFEQENRDNHIFRSSPTVYGIDYHGGECQIQGGH
ncbi:hypothetical protein V3F56_03235 [Moorellaceae bacterium AZ2]